MGKKKGKGGASALIFKIVKIAVFVFLLANFCWNGQPLWKNVIPSNATVEKSEKAVKKESEKVQKIIKEVSDDAENTAKKALDETKKVVEDAKDAIKAPSAEITEKEEEELEEIIKQNLNK